MAAYARGGPLRWQAESTQLAELGAGIHYTRAAPFAPLPLAAVQSAHSGAGAYSHAGAFFYGAAAEMADWCGTYLEHALRYQEAG